MPQQLARLLSKTALFALLAATAGCTTLENTYDNIMGKNSSTVAPRTVKSPNAAPVQSVSTQEIDNSQKQAVELGSMSDPSLATSAPTPVGSTTQPRIVPLSEPPANVATQAPITPAPVVVAPAPDQPVVIAAPTNAPVPVAVAAPSEAPVPVITTAPAPAPTPANTVALLTVRFNQPHVYYDDALNQAVQMAEKAKPGISYDVLSTVPDLSSLPPEQQAKLSARAKDNLRNVVVKMQQYGVNSERIRIAEQTLRIRSQEIQLFVR